MVGDFNFTLSLKKKIHQQQSFPKFEENKNKQQATYPKI